MVAAVLSPVAIQDFFVNGIPATGAKLFTYSAGTTTKLAAYTDQSADTAFTNPIILNARGEPQSGGGSASTPIWLLPGQAYKFVLAPSTDSDPPTNPIWTADNIGGSTVTDYDGPFVIAGANPTVDLGLYGLNVQISGNNTIQSFGTSAIVGQEYTVRFTGFPTITYNSTSMILPNEAQNLGITPGDVIKAKYLGSGNWLVFAYSPAAVWSVTPNASGNNPYYPVTFAVGNPANVNTPYPDLAFFGQYSDSHFGGRNLILGNVGDIAKLWAFGDNGTAASPTFWTVPIAQLQVVIWGLDNTGARVASTSVGPGQSAYQGRQAQLEMLQYGTQTQTSRPGAMTFGVGRSGWQVPVTAGWFDDQGGWVLTGASVAAAVAATTLSYPWSSGVDDYSPIPNLNWSTYTSDAVETLIISDSGTQGVRSMYRWDAIASSSAKTGFKENYVYSSGVFSFDAVTTGTPTTAWAATAAGKVFFGGVKAAIGSDASPLQSTQAGGTALALNRTSSTGGLANFYQAGTAVGSISVTGSATAYNTSSDYRLKEDFQPVDASKFDALKVYDFAWRADGSRTTGFVAHELAEVVPEAVFGLKDAVNDDGSIQPQGVDQSKVVPLIVAKVQSLAERVAALEDKAA